MARIMEQEDCSKLNELRTANSRALDELVIYVNKTGATDEERYRLLLADVERTWGEFSAFARRFLRVH